MGAAQGRCAAESRRAASTDLYAAIMEGTVARVLSRYFKTDAAPEGSIAPGCKLGATTWKNGVLYGNARTLKEFASTRDSRYGSCALSR